MAIFKILLGGTLLWLATELGKRSGKMGGLVLSLPITSMIAFLAIWFETKDPMQVANVSKQTLVFILPSFVFFIALPILLQKSVNFYFSFMIATSLTLVSYFTFYKLRGEL
jgi:hypothetical protein